MFQILKYSKFITFFSETNFKNIKLKKYVYCLINRNIPFRIYYF